MRLIDADKMKIGISEQTRTDEEASLFIDVIDGQPTVYDTDKVVKRLKSESKRWEMSGKECEDKRELGVAEGLRRAIEIIKSGGIET